MRRGVFLVLLASSFTFASPAKKGYSNSPSKSSQSEDSEEFVDISDAPVRNAEAAASPLLPLKKDVDYNLNPRPLFCFQSYERPDKPCVPDQAVSCISTSIRKTNDSEAAFFARCSSQTCDEFEQDLKSELVKTPGTEINYTCCSTPGCNALPYGKGFQMTSSNLEAKSVKFPLNGDPDGEMSFVARHQPREEEQLMNYRRTPLTCLYTGPFGALYPVVCKLEDATSCVSFTNYYRDGTKRFTATCSRFSCDQFEKAIKIELGRGHLKHIDFKCCKDNNCNRHSDAFRLSVPEITIGEAVALPAASHKDGPTIIPPTPVRTSLGGGGYARP